MIHKEGKQTLLIVGSILLLCLAAFAFSRSIWLIPVSIICLILFAFFIQFFRNPTRTISVLDNNLIYAPADGKVVVIEKVFEAEYYKAERLQVSIFMSPINVHVNRAPISGTILFDKYHPGKYLVAWDPKASSENERTSIVIGNSNQSILLRQIAGALARRIVYYVHEGDSIQQGEDIGFIKLGSRVDVFLPLDAKVLVNINDTVYGNTNVIARFKS